MIEALRQFEVPGVITFDRGSGALPRAKVHTRWSHSEIYLHGAQVTGFQKHGEPPFLFLSRRSRFEPNRAIRGGIPLCFPWFGSRSGMPAHGFARINDWQVLETATLPDGSAELRFGLPVPVGEPGWTSLRAELTVTVAAQLELNLSVTNQAEDRSIEFEECLHTYFAVGDVAQTSIVGLNGVTYRDKVAENAVRTESAEAIQIKSQTDRTYLHTAGTVEIRDPVLHRTIRIDKSGSASTVVWNPWTTQVLTDLGPDEYGQMVCVESGNVEENGVTLRPGASERMRVRLSSVGL
jgi:glucose-6-phosphate 1-epimerase